MLVLGIASVCAILSYVAFSLDLKKHWLLQIIILVFVVTLSSVVIPTVTLDYEQVCEPVVANQTVLFNTTTFQYEDHCYDRTNVPSVFAKAGYWFIRVFFVYYFFWMLWEMFIKNLFQKFRDRRDKG